MKTRHTGQPSKSMPARHFKKFGRAKKTRLLPSQPQTIKDSRIHHNANKINIASKTKIAAQCVASEPGVYFCLQYIVPASNQVSLLGYFLPNPVLVEYKTHTQGHHRQPPKVQSQGLKLQWRLTRYTDSHKSFTT